MEPARPDQPTNAAAWRERASRLARMTAAVLLHGLGSGLIGIFIALLIRKVQVASFGYNEGGFLEIAVQSPPARRMLCVFLGGVFGAAAWYWLRGREPAFVSVEDCMKGAWMPPGVTLINGMIQDIVVALGGSFGREAAPREISAMWGCVLAHALGITGKDRTFLVACGTGAGLAAVYSVPISGVFYTIEHVLHWDMSLSAVIPAVVTSIVATVTTSAVVDTDGLYAMPNYSYRWPSMQMLLWSAAIGPIAGSAAICFRRAVKFAEQLKPQARVHMNFSLVELNQTVRLDSPDDGALSTKQEAIVTRKTSDFVTVRLKNTHEKGDYNLETWVRANPEGRRDWTILVVMPTVFLALGILSHDFPGLLGNGRALATVAIHRDRTPSKFLMLLVLKGVMTTAAIGSGAAGGTLTPSVALGATLGAVVGEMFQYALPGWAPRDDAPMSVVAAAAFLAVAMRSPVTSFWLLTEFSAQGIKRADLLALLHGDVSGVVRSKLAVGMLLPLGIAVGGAMLTTYFANTLWAAVQPRKAPHTIRERSPSVDLDLGRGDDEELGLDDHARDVCFTCFSNSLLFNTCLTVAVAAAAPSCHHAITKVSALGVLMAVAIGGTLWCFLYCNSRRKDFVAVAPFANEHDVLEENLKGEENEMGIDNLKGEETPKSRHGWRHSSLGLACALLLAVLGAIVPLAPWALHVWQNSRGGVTALTVSAVCAVAAGACGAMVNRLSAESKQSVSVTAVVQEAVVIAVAAAGAYVVGTLWGLWRQELACLPGMAEAEAL